MSFYNPDQHTEPQQGLAPHRSLEELIHLFCQKLGREKGRFKPIASTIREWEQFKARLGVSVEN